jgi:hypothetical protein
MTILERTLKAYGFGDKYIKYSNTLYNGLSVKVMVNGFFSEKINIERGVKQRGCFELFSFYFMHGPTN